MNRIRILIAQKVDEWVIYNHHNWHLKYAKIHTFSHKLSIPMDGGIQTGEIIVGEEIKVKLIIKGKTGKISMDNGYEMDFHCGEIIVRKAHEPIINEWGVLLNPIENEMLTIEIKDIARI